MQSQVRLTFNKVPEKVRQGSGKDPEKCREGLGGFGAERGQVQQGSGEGSEEGSGKGSGEGSGRLWCRARSHSTGFGRKSWRRFREALVQSQIRFNRVPENNPEKVWEALV